MHLKAIVFLLAFLASVAASAIAYATPTAVNDHFYVVENYGTVVLSPLANDSSSVGAGLQITSTTTPSHGSLSTATGGVWVLYTPNTGFSGTDTFNYTMTDGYGTASATVTVTVMPTQPSPAISMLSAPMVTPTNAWTFYGASTTHTADPSWATTRPEIAALAISLGAGRAGITAAQYSQNVVTYIRNNIATEFRFGLGKGARGALIDQSGTPFDQADLMVQLLRQNGITANYQIGTATLTPSQFGLWSGLVQGLNQSAQTFTISAQAACHFLADGGIPAVINGVTDNGSTSYCNAQVSGNLTSVTMIHVWVSANGYLYDPSFKVNYLKAGIDLAAAMGCGTESSPTCGTTTQTAVMTGATSGTLGSTGSPTLSGLNETSALSQLTAFATALETTIKSTNAIAAVQDIVGGPVFNPTYNPTPSSSLPYTTSVQATWTGLVPDQYRTTVSYQFCGQTITAMGDVWAGRRIRQWPTKQPGAGEGNYVGPTAASTYIDDIDVLDCNWSYGAPYASSSMTLTVQPPYAASSGTYGNTTSTSNVLDLIDYGPDLPLSLYVQLGEATESTVSYYTDLGQADPSPFHAGAAGAPNCNTNLGITPGCGADVTLTGFQLLSDQSRAVGVVGAIAGAAVRHHVRVGYESGAPGYPGGGAAFGEGAVSNFDSISGSMSSESFAGDATTANAAFELATNVSSMLEGAVGGDIEPYSGATSFVLANRSGGQFVDVTPSNMSAVIPDLTNYDSRTYALQGLANAGYESIIPVNGQVGCIIYNGTTCITTFPAGGPLPPDYEIQSGVSIGLLVQELLKGGTNTGGIDPTGQVLATVKTTTEMKTALRQGAAVDMASGQLNLTPPPDIVSGAGDFPASLPFQRYYQASGAVIEHRDTSLEGNPKPIWTYTGPDSLSYDRLGGGWQHNYQIMANWTSDVPAGLGQYRALDASAFIASAYIDLTLLKSPTFASRMTALFADYWQAKQLVNNAVMVKSGPKTSEFTRIPDGSFAPPRGSGAQLVQTGTAPAYKFGVALPADISCIGPPFYDYTATTLTLTNPSGDAILFNNAAQQTTSGNGQCDLTIGLPIFKASTWTFPNGNTLNFIYTAELASGNPLFSYTMVDVLTQVSNSYGRQLNFSTTWAGETYDDPNGREQALGIGWVINSVTDENSRAVQIARSNCPTFYLNYGSPGISGSAGAANVACNTVSVTTPDGAVWSYNYAPGAYSPDPSIITRAPYHLRQWFPPSSPGMAYETVGYDPLYRTATLTDPLSHVTSYYAQALFSTEVWKRSQEYDALGNITTNVFDQWNNLLQATDPLGRTSTYSYDTANRKILAVSPLWGCVATTYDVRSNLLASYKYPSAVSGSTPTGTCTVSGWAAALPPNGYSPAPITTYPSGAITTSSTYNEAATVYPCVHPVTCNKPATETDALGNVTSYSWDATTGNLTQVLKPADLSGVQPQTNLVYTPLSGSSACSNGATAGGMALVCQKTDKISPTSNLLTTYTYNGSNKYVLATATVDPSGLDLRTCFKFDAYGNLISTSDPRATSCP